MKGGGGKKALCRASAAFSFLLSYKGLVCVRLFGTLEFGELFSRENFGPPPLHAPVPVPLPVLALTLCASKKPVGSESKLPLTNANVLASPSLPLQANEAQPDLLADMDSSVSGRVGERMAHLICNLSRWQEVKPVNERPKGGYRCSTV